MPVKKIALLASLALLAACDQSPTAAPEPAATPAAAVTPAQPALPSPSQEVFASVFAETCPKAEKVATSVCKRAGMGSEDVLCEFGVGEDTALRHKATLTAGEGKWTLADAEKVCAEHNSHHVAS
ncbi:MAG: hypothetical protein ACEQR8_01350 [Cypionkella sp.]